MAISKIVLIGATVALAVIAIVFVVSQQEDTAPTVLDVNLDQQSGVGYLNWLKWTAGLHGGKAADSNQFMDIGHLPQQQDFGKMSAAGKIIFKLQKSINREKRIIKRLEKFMSTRKNGKQPESIVVHVGQVGSPGIRGRPGPRGIRGDRGRPGKTGPRGAPGDLGRTGPRGDTGPIGPEGRKGRDGRRGVAGRDGPRGEQGPQGPTGPIGSRGLAGSPGKVGLQGKNGHRGPDGPQGIRGPRGGQGPRGAEGPPGRIIPPLQENVRVH